MKNNLAPIKSVQINAQTSSDIVGRIHVDPAQHDQVTAVSVVVETMKQLEAQMLMRNYEGFIK